MGTITIKNLIGGDITITTKPVASPKTKITFADGTSQEYDWKGEITRQMMIDAGLYDINKHSWIKEPQTVVEASFEVVPIIPRLAWTTEMALTILPNDILVASTVIPSCS